MAKKIRKKDKNVLKWMFTVCKKQVPLMILLVVLNAIYGVSSVFFAKFSKNIIDGATQAKDFNIVIKFALCMLGLVVFQMALNITKNSLSERCSARLEMILKKYILDLVIKKDYQKVTTFHTGDLQNRMFNDATLVASGFTTIIPESAFFGAKLLSALIYLSLIRFLHLYLLSAAVLFLSLPAFSEKRLKGFIKKCRKQREKHVPLFRKSCQIFLLLRLFRLKTELMKLQMNFKMIILKHV